MQKLWKRLPGGLLLVLLLIAVLAQALWVPGLFKSEDANEESGIGAVLTKTGLDPGSRLPGKDKSDFPRTLQDARFVASSAGVDRFGYEADAHGTHLVYMESQGDSVTAGASLVILQSLIFADDGSKSWTDDLDDTKSTTGTIKIPAPADAVGFGYQLALNDHYLLVGAKWSQEVYVFDFTGALIRTITAPVASGRCQEVLNFGESLEVDDNLLVVGAPNSTVDGFEDAVMAFSFDLSASGSAAVPLLAPKGAPSIADEALVGQEVAVRSGAVALGCPGFGQSGPTGTVLKGVLQVFDHPAFSRDLMVDAGQGSYPTGADGAMAGLGRSLAFSKDGMELFAGDPSWGPASAWTAQHGVVFRFTLADETIREIVRGDDDTNYFGASLALGEAQSGADILYVSYCTATDAGRVDGYAVDKAKGTSKRSTFKPSDSAGDAGFGSQGLLGGALVANTYSDKDGDTCYNLLVTAAEGVYHFGTPLPLKLAKMTDPVDGEMIFPGQKLTFTLMVDNLNRGSTDTVLTDDLSKVLPFSKSGTVDNGKVEFGSGSPAEPAPVIDQDTGRLAWEGWIPGASATGPGRVQITDDITAEKSEDSACNAKTIESTVVSDYSKDTPVTRNGPGKIDLVKRLLIVAQDGTESEVPTDATLACGQQYVYEIEVTNALPEDAKASPVQTMVRDDMGSIIDDGRIGVVSIKGAEPLDSVTWNDAGFENQVVWKGALGKGQSVTVRVPVTTYPADHVPTGDHQMKNLASNDRCPDSPLLSNAIVDTRLTKAAFGQESEAIDTIRKGKPVLYRITYTNSTPVTILHASVSDDLSDALQYAEEPTVLEARSDRAGHLVAKPGFDAVTWKDTSGIKPGETVTISYRMPVKQVAKAGSNMVNTAKSEQTSQTAHSEVKILGMDPVSRLPLTGSNLLWYFLVPLIGLLMVLAGYSVYQNNRHFPSGRGRTLLTAALDGTESVGAGENVLSCLHP